MPVRKNRSLSPTLALVKKEASFHSSAQDESVRDVAAPRLLNLKASVKKPVPSPMKRLLLKFVYSYPPTTSRVVDEPALPWQVSSPWNVRVRLSRSYWRALPLPRATPTGFASGE